MPPSDTIDASVRPPTAFPVHVGAALRLSDEQKQVVEAPLVSQLVLAGPGTGKTRTLAHRAVHVITRLDVPPATVLAVTYTNKATEEMRDRLRRLLPGDAGRLIIGTFHSFCIQLLRRHYEHVGLPKHFGVADEAAQIAVLQRLRPHMTADNAKHALKSFSQARIGTSRPRPGTPLAAAPEDLLRASNPFFAEYEAHLRCNALIDFDDILTLTERLLADAAVLAEVRAGLHYILVDEFQDTDAAQYAVLQRLALDWDANAKAYRNVIPVFAVADDDQSIFAWRGARPENIHQFFTEFLAGEDAAVHRLETNYRCSGNIVAAANRLLAHAPRLFRKNPRAHRPAGAEVRLHRYADADAETHGVAQDILRLRQAGVPFSAMAVLYRRHDTGEAFESALLALGVPCQVVRRKSVYDAPEVKRLLLLMRATLNPDDDLAVAELIGLIADDVLRGKFEALRGQFAARWRGAAAAPKRALRRALRAALEDRDPGLRRTAGRVIGLLKVGETCLAAAACLSDWIAAVGAFLDSDAPPPAPPTTPEDMRKGALWLARLSELEGALVVAAESPLIEDAATWLLTQTLAGHARFRTVARHTLPETPPHAKAVLLALDAAAECEATARWKFSAVVALEDGPRAHAEASRSRLVIRTDALPADERGARPSRFVALWTLARAYLAQAMRPLFADYTVVDLETTDKDATRCDIVEAAAARVRGGRVTETYAQLIKPTLEPISPKAQETHHITPEMVAAAPTFDAVAPALLDFLGDDLLVAHNGLTFDFPILKRRLNDVGRKFDNPLFDTLPFARQLYADRPAVKRFRLEDLAALHGVDAGTAHRALDDVKTLAEVFERMQEDYNRRRGDALGADTLGILALTMLLEMDEVEAADSRLFQAGAALWKSSADEELLMRLADEPDAARAVAVWRRRVGAASEEPAVSRPAATLAAMAKRYDDLPVLEGMAALLDFTRLFTTADTWRDCDAVTLMTVHAAKGLEFGYVWLPALEEPSLGTNNAKPDAGKLAEERRLLYVALTRAERQVVLSWAAQRTVRQSAGDARLQAMRRLSFLDELDCVETARSGSEDGSAAGGDVT